MTYKQWVFAFSELLAEKGICTIEIPIHELEYAITFFGKGKTPEEAVNSLLTIN